MAEITPRDALTSIVTAFQTYWATVHPEVPVALPNAPFNPPGTAAGTTEADDDAWVRVFGTGFTDAGHVPYSGSVQNAFFADRGRITFEVYVRQGQGVGNALDLAYAIQGFLDNGARHADVIFSNRTAPQSVGGDGAWFQVIQAADWLYFNDKVAP